MLCINVFILDCTFCSLSLFLSESLKPNLRTNLKVYSAGSRVSGLVFSNIPRPRHLVDLRTPVYSSDRLSYFVPSGEGSVLSLHAKASPTLSLNMQVLLPGSVGCAQTIPPLEQILAHATKSGNKICIWSHCSSTRKSVKKAMNIWNLFSN